MADLKEQLAVKGAKCNLQFTRAEREYFEQECGFTDEEVEIFRMRSRGFSVVKIMHEMEQLRIRSSRFYKVIIKVKSGVTQGLHLIFYYII